MAAAGPGAGARMAAFPARWTAMSQATMKALVKREAAKGIWMEQVPVPSPGPNEVLIKLEKTAICGTDLHIYLWDEWSQRTIKPGLVRLRAWPAGQRGRPHRLRALPQLPRRQAAPVPEHGRHRREPQRRLRRIHRDAGQQPVADPRPDPQRAGRVLRPLRQCRPLRAGVRRGRRGRADHRRRPDRHHCRRHLQAHRRAQRGGHRRQRLPPQTGRRHGRHPGRQRPTPHSRT